MPSARGTDASCCGTTLEQLTRIATPADVTSDVVVVDNKSSDSTSAVIDEGRTRLPLVSLFEPVAGKAHALNRCLREASGDYIDWTEDDILVDEEWLSEFAAAAKRYSGAAVFGRARSTRRSS